MNRSVIINPFKMSELPAGPLSKLAETLIGSEIVRLGADIKEKMTKGDKIYNFTIGDFDSAIFPIPEELKDDIIEAYNEKFTTYPPAEGILTLRDAVSRFVKMRQGLDYSSGEIIIAAGGRPLIYALYRAIVDKGDKVIYAVPSWNNNHYVHFTEGEHRVIETTVANNFMPTASDIAPHIKGAALLALCAPLNPTGTTFQKKELEEICDLIIAENNSRSEHEKKLYVLFDQIYWTLTFGSIEHYNPVSLRPEMKKYTIFIDGISKAFAATGVRVGWSMGPRNVLDKMKAINSHVGAWSPMAEQHATAKYLLKDEMIDNYFKHFKHELDERLTRIFEGFKKLKGEGFSVDAITPQAAIYLTIQIDLVGKTTPSGTILKSQDMVTEFILNAAGLAIVPFYVFGASHNSNWYRLSVGTCKKEEIDEMLARLKEVLSTLK